MTVEQYAIPHISKPLTHFRTPLHTIFERIVQEHPNRQAVTYKGTSLTYNELNKRANVLAYWLILNDIKKERRVGVCLRPGFEIITVLLAIQKANGVYVPIDPDYPKARISKIVEDAALTLTISQNDIIERNNDIFIRPYTYQQIKSITSTDKCYNPITTNCETNTAYIFYTSGTTGQPKGIAISYDSFAFYILSAINQFGLNSDDTTLTVAKFSFSISLFELMTSIISGGRLIILSRNEIMNYGHLAAALEHVTIMHIGPGMLRGLISYIRTNYRTYQQFVGLRHVSSGGDFVSADLLEDIKQIFDHADIYVIYGCTEIACMGCFYSVPWDSVVERSFIGKPFDGMETILLNDAGEIAIDGEIGEICFSGPGIMKGYLNKPELTRNALAHIGDNIYFKTGDIGRVHSSGNIEFLGRRDFQIKIRGHRVELLEIEGHLRRAPGVSDAIVVSAEIGSYEKRLVAYLTLKDPTRFQLDAVRLYLHERLPDYMQPSGWIVLDNMPLNENFKIARKALPAATLENFIVTEHYVAPRNETECILTTLWERALDIQRVGINDNFFNIGGDSLMAMTVSMLAAEKGISVSPLQMAEAPTIAGLVKVGVGVGVGRCTTVDDRSHDANSIGTILDLPPFLLRFLYERGTQTPHRWNISRILIAKKRLSFELIDKAFRHLGERHDALRLRFNCDDDLWRASILATSEETLACRMVDLSDVPTTKQAAAMAKVADNCQRELNLTNGPIACIVLFELGKGQPQELFFVVHHFAMDVVSWRTFWLEFESVYEQLEAGKDFTLPHSMVSFQTWTQIMRQYADSFEVEANVQNWIGQSWSEVHSLPEDLSDESYLNTNDSAELVRFTLSKEETRAITRGIFGFDVECILISAITFALGRWQNSGVVYFDRLVHSRNVGPEGCDFSRIIGCLLGYAPTLMKIDTQASVGDILHNVSEQIKHVGDSGTSIDLFRYLGSQPSLVERLQALPRAEVLFNYRGHVDSVIERSNLFEKTREIAGLDHNPKGLRQYPISIVLDIIDDRLELRFVYSTNLHKRENIDALCAEYTNFLRLFINRPLLPHYAIPSVDTEKQLVTPTGVVGYRHPHYAASLSEFGTPRHLPRSDGWILERPIPGTTSTDAMGCYPLFDCGDWSQLSADLEELQKELVSLTLIPAPFAPYDRALLERCFDRVVHFKDHFVADLSRPVEEIVKRTHRKSARRALRNVVVRVCTRPEDHLDTWAELFSTLAEKHNIKGLRAFSKQAFAAQLNIPGMVMFEALADGATVGLDLWYVQGDVAYGHLAAFNAHGYKLSASYATKWFLMHYFADKVRWIDFGGVAGADSNGSDGLVKFKRGWSTGTKPVYLCGRIFQPDAYNDLVEAWQAGVTEYFPAYRKGEFTL